MSSITFKNCTRTSLVGLRSMESSKSSTSAEEPQPSNQIADMLNSSSGIDKSEEHPCESAINAAEKEIVPDAVEIFPDVPPENVEGNTLQSTEPAVESVSLQEIQTAESEVKPPHASTMESEEPEPRNQQELDAPIINVPEELNEVKNATTSSPECETSPVEQSSPKYFHEDSLDVNGDTIEETTMEPTDRDDHLEKLHFLEGFNSEIHLPAPEETESLEPPVKKRLRRRMGMCGLGDRKKKLLVDGQICNQGLKGLLHHSLLENDDITPMNHQGTTRPACEKNIDVLKEGPEVMDTERRTDEEENIQRNMSEFIAMRNDEGLSDESHQGSGDVQEKGILEEKYETVIFNGKRTAGELVVEDIPTVLRSTIGRNLNMIQGESSRPTSTNDLEMEIGVCDVEPNVLGSEMFLRGPDIEFKLKHDVLHEQDMEFNLKYCHADDEVDEKPEEPALDVQGPTIERSENPVIVTKEVREAPTDLEESEMEIEAHCPSNMAEIEKPNPHEPSGPTEKYLDPFVPDVTSAEIQTAGGPGGTEKPSAGISEITEPPGDISDDSKEISQPTAPPAFQEIHLRSLSDQNSPETPINPSAFQQQICNSTLPPAAEDLCVPSSLYSMTDSQLHKIALSMELDDESIPGNPDRQEDATELVRGLVRELSSLK